MPFFDFEDVVDNIVDEFFLDKQDDNGVYHHERLPKNFLKLSLVSRNFLRPVRRNLYRDVHIEGTERFLLLTGQLRFSPHLANFVKTASVVSNCLQHNHIDGDIDDGPGWEPRSVSTTALRWFLDACPQLTELTVYGGDLLLALASQAPQNVKLTDITIVGCSRCNTVDSPSCTDDLAAGWLKNVVAFPRLKELDISEIQIGGPGLDATKGIPSRSYGAKTLLHSMPALAELVLDGLKPMPRGELKNCLNIVAKTLELLTITDYHSTEDDPQPWENDTVAGLHQLKTLCFNSVPVTPSLLDMLPPRLEYLRLSRNALTRLPAPILAAWLRRERFPLRGVLKKFEVIGELRRDSAKRGPKASAEQVAELSRLCAALGIEWIYTSEKFRFF